MTAPYGRPPAATVHPTHPRPPVTQPTRGHRARDGCIGQPTGGSLACQNRCLPVSYETFTYRHIAVRSSHFATRKEWVDFRVLAFRDRCLPVSYAEFRIINQGVIVRKRAGSGTPFLRGNLAAVTQAYDRDDHYVSGRQNVGGRGCDLLRFSEQLTQLWC